MMLNTQKYSTVIKSFKLLLMSGSMFLIIQCGKDDETAAVSASSFAPVYAILSNTDANCANCHKPDLTAGGSNFDVSSQSTAYSSLTSSNSTYSGCTSFKLVDSGEPSTSYLLAILYEDYNAAFTGCTTDDQHLPTGSNIGGSGPGRALLDDNKSTIVNWITAGAAQ